jgi:hypothetical protein
MIPFPLKSGMIQECPFLLLLFNIVFGIPSQNNKTGERNKKDSNRKKEIKLSLFTDSMILYLKYPKNSIKKLLDYMNTFSKLAGYKIIILKLVAF